MKSPAADRSSQRLQPGRHGLDRAFVVSNQRDRILDAIAQEVARKGYAEVTVADVIARAGVSRKTFYALFRDKADCFLAAFDAAVEILVEQVAAAFEATPEATPERARAAIAAMLDVFAQEPAFARMCMVEAPGAGPEARERFETVVDGFLPLFERLEEYQAGRRHVGSVRLSAVTPRAVIGGIAWVISKQIIAGQTERLPDLLPELTHFLLAPFLGEQDAAKYALDVSLGQIRKRSDPARAGPSDAAEPLAVRRTDSRGRHGDRYAQTMANRGAEARPKATAASPPRAPRGRRARPDGRPALTRQAIVEAAIRIADADGLRAVSIRRIAAELDVGPMSLYTHVADKADLLALMGNEFVALTLVEEPLPADWRTALSQIARRMHAAFIAHPWIVEIATQRPSLGDNVVKHARQLAGTVDGLGLEPAEVWTLLGIVDDYVLGHALRVPTTGNAQVVEDAASPEELTEFPELTALADVDLGRSSDKQFDVGLQTVLDGVEHRFLTPQAARRRKRARAQKPRAARTARRSNG